MTTDRGTAAEPAVSVLAGIALVSMSVLAMEVLLTRIFSFSIWYHFAYLAINMALLGFGAAGSWVAVRPSLVRETGRRTLLVASALSGLAFVAFLLWFARNPLQPQTLFERPWGFAASLLLYYAGITIPFFLAGLTIAVALSRFSGRVARLYAWDLTGAGVGALAALVLLNRFGGPEAVLMVGGLLLIASGLLGWREDRRLALVAAVLGTVLVLAAPSLGSRIVVVPADSTYVAELHRQPEDFVTVASEWNAINRIDVYRDRDLSNSQAQWSTDGIREGFAGEVPPVYYLIYDAHNRSDVYRYDGAEDTLAFLDEHLFKTPYLLLDEPEVLVIGSGGGIDVLNALRNGASRVTAVELQPAVVRLLRGELSDWVGQIYGAGSPVSLIAAEGRNFVERTDRRYDLIQFTATDTWSALNTGAYVLMESYLYTEEAISAYIDRLTEDGVLCILVWDLIYERGEYVQPVNSRLINQYLRVLARKGATSPEGHLMILGKKEWYRNIFTVPILKRTPFRYEEVERLRSFAGEMGFEVLFDPLGEPTVANALAELISAEERSEFLAASFYDLRPTTDERPFFFNCYKWSNLFSDRRFRWDAPVSGQLVLLILLGQSLLLAVAFILLPLVVSRRTRLSPGGNWALIGFFACLGVGFMLLEISLIQKFVLFLGYPAYAFAATLSALLVSSGLGSRLSGRFARVSKQVLGGLFGGLAAVVVLQVFLFPWIFDRLIGLSLVPRLAIAMIAQAPLGLVLGMYFPLGIRVARQRDERLVPWMWGINGVSSVVATVLTILLATAFGFRVVALIALALYGLGALSLARTLGREEVR